MSNSVMTKRILFVDDEPMVLKGIERSLRSIRGQWEMEFAGSGPDALAIMDGKPFDVVISDMRMPGMDGAELLEQVKAKYPRTVRMVLSGQSDQETILRSVGPTHQYISKPCDVEELKRKLSQAFALRELLDNPSLKEIVSRMDTVPSLPSLYVEMTHALQSPDISIAELGNIIAKDMGMSSKVLQLANSAFFGLSCQVSSPKQAVTLIGTDNIRALVLSVHVFSELRSGLDTQLAFLWPHSCATGGLAMAVARCQGVGQKMMDEAFAAGLLHDVGRLVLASSCGEQYIGVLQEIEKRHALVSDVEQEVFGCTHAEVGAYLLGLWGLPDSIIEAVAWHHTPARSAPTGFSPLIAIHFADNYDHQRNASLSQKEPSQLDEELLKNLGLHDQLKTWTVACQELHAEGDVHG
jgi:HD-like signal output (HDOD) protein/CheY-like chemotaxis protein